MTLTKDALSSAIIKTEYAVRGPIVAKAQELERAGKNIIYCNIGNPQALKQKPLTWPRQILAACEYPELLDHTPCPFPKEVAQTVKHILKEMKNGTGAYTESKGLRFIREAIAQFITQRDQIPTDPEAIFLTDGASKGVQAALRMLIADSKDGIMIPIPQYPLYSATITLYEAEQVGYYLDEAHQWMMNETMLENSIQEAKSRGIKVRALCVINPGNPTGSVMTEENIAMCIRFAKKHQLTIIADEVYQDNIYLDGSKFVSFAKVLHQMNEKEVTLFSFHSVSKGYLGECGHRGGYMEYRNLPADVASELLKLQSVSLCSNVTGQLVTYLMVLPPPPNTPSYNTYMEEKNNILNSLQRKSKMLAQGLNKIEGISCNIVAGAMYAFPKITLPEGVSDFEYCMTLLEQTGICVVPGSGFGQFPGTAHFRTTILPPEEEMELVVEHFANFHYNFCNSKRV